jgi:hypothetical protein
MLYVITTYSDVGQFSAEKLAYFQNNTLYDPIFTKFSSAWSINANFVPIFSAKITTSVPEL